MVNVVYSFNVYWHGIFISQVIAEAGYGAYMNSIQKKYTFSTGKRLN